MAHLQVLCTVLACFTIYFTGSCDGKTRFSRRCVDMECIGLECDVEPEGCRYGTTKDVCTNLTVCKKGPGERCGGRHMQHGLCGDGLTCNCGECSNCYIDDPTDCHPFKFCHDNYIQSLISAY